MLTQVHLLDSATARAFEAIVDLPTNLRDGVQVDTPVVSDWVALEGTVQPSLQVEELLWSEEICRKDPEIAKAARAVGVEPENLYVDGEFSARALGQQALMSWLTGWCIGIDERFPDRRLQQCFLFTRLRPEDNLYAHPLDFIPVIGM